MITSLVLLPVSNTIFKLFFFNFYFYFILLYNTVLVLPYIDMNPPRMYMCSQTWTPPPAHFPPHNIPLGHPRAPATSMLYPSSDIDWRFISYMIAYMFQCHSPKSSHPHPLPQSPKDCSIHLCLFCYLAYRIHGVAKSRTWPSDWTELNWYRVIVTIFLNSIYMH